MKIFKDILYQVSVLSVLLVACTDKEEEMGTEYLLPDPVAIHLDISDVNTSLVPRGAGYVPASYAGTGPIALTLHPAEMILPSGHPLNETFSGQDLNESYHYKLTATRDNSNSKWYFQGYQINKDTEDETSAVDNKPDASQPNKVLTSPYWANLSTVYKIFSLAGLYKDFPEIIVGNNNTDVSKEKNPFLWQNTPEGYANANLMKFETDKFIPREHLLTADDKSSPVVIGPFTSHLLSQLHIIVTLNKKQLIEGYSYELAILGTTNRYIYDSATGTVTPGDRTTGVYSFPAPYDAIANPNADPLQSVECIRALHISTDKDAHTVEFAAIVVPGQEEIQGSADSTPFLVLTISNKDRTDITYLLYLLTSPIAANTFSAGGSYVLNIDLSGASVDPNPGVRNLSPNKDLRVIPMKGTINIEKGEWK